MNFASALFSLKRGFKIKRKDWIGYWQLEGDSIMIHCKDGRVFNLVDSEDILFTIEQMACDDWEVVTTADNVGLPHNPAVEKKQQKMKKVKKYNLNQSKDDQYKNQPPCYITDLQRALCLRSNNGWTPYGFTDAQIENAKVSDCKVCYKYKDKWIPWNEIKAMINSEISDSNSFSNDPRITTNIDQRTFINNADLKARTGYINTKNLM